MSGEVSTRELREQLRRCFVWRGDRTDQNRYADVTGWWRTPAILGNLGQTLGLLVDDWIDTGGQALGARRLIQEAQATWLGVATIVDALQSHEVRRQLNVRALLHLRDLP